MLFVSHVQSFMNTNVLHNCKIYARLSRKFLLWLVSGFRKSRKRYVQTGNSLCICVMNGHKSIHTFKTVSKSLYREAFEDKSSNVYNISIRVLTYIRSNNCGNADYISFVVCDERVRPPVAIKMKIQS